MTQCQLFPETSLAAYDAQDGDKLSRDHAAIVNYVVSQREHGATRWEIHKATGIAYTTVTPRVLELLHAGKLLQTTRKRLTGNGCKAFVIVAGK